MSTEPPSPVPPPRSPLSRFLVMLIVISLIPSLVFGALVVLRLFGMVRPFYIPTGSMIPAISPGDHVVMEAMTYLDKRPDRGDIVVYKSNGNELLKGDIYYTKRIAGDPGDHLLISNGDLFINDKLTVLSNDFGAISYVSPAARGFQLVTNLTVPAGSYFLLGDNSTNSLDSRYIGVLPREDIVGRIVFCYWPPDRFGEVK